MSIDESRSPQLTGGATKFHCRERLPLPLFDTPRISPIAPEPEGSHPLASSSYTIRLPLLHDTAGATTIVSSSVSPSSGAVFTGGGADGIRADSDGSGAGALPE